MSCDLSGLLLLVIAVLLNLVSSYLFPVMPPQLFPLKDRRYKTTSCVRVNLDGYLQIILTINKCFLINSSENILIFNKIH